MLIRGAYPAFTDPIGVRDVLALAANPEVNARLVCQAGRRWTLDHGPFTAASFKQLPRRDWTVLVQDTNHFSDRAAAMLEGFDFIPHARVDDLMVSYAVPGGGVGPHVDSYDVFLVQGHGQRRWRISSQADLAFREGLPLRILARFKPDREWVLEAGDMLYLPPGIAHHGIAESECLTWSVGFRAPTNQDWAEGFLDFLRDRVTLAGQYRDAGAGLPRHAGEIPPGMIEHARRTLSRIRWTATDVRDFAGRYLSEPKAHVVLEPPQRSLTRARFAALAAREGVAVDRRARLLFSGSMFFMNGDAISAKGTTASTLRVLADHRRLAGPVRAGVAFWDLAHAWYLQGALHISGKEPRP